MRRAIIVSLLSCALLFVAPPAFGQGSGVLELEPECVRMTEANHTLVLLVEGGNLQPGTTLRAYDPRGVCVGESDVPETGNVAIALWGADAMSGTGGLLTGEPFRIVAVVPPSLGGDGAERPVYYTLEFGPLTYVPHGRTTVSAPTVAAPGEVEVAFRVPSGSVRGEFVREIDITGAFGALLLEVRSDGAALTRIALDPADAGALETHVEDTLAALAVALPGLDSYVVSVSALPDSGAGSLEVARVEAVDSTGAVLAVRVTQGATEYTFLVLGDANGDGVVSLSDLRAVFLDLIRIVRLEEEERARADASPYPGGDGRITLADFLAITKALVRGRWPDGSAL